MSANNHKHIAGKFKTRRDSPPPTATKSTSYNKKHRMLKFFIMNSIVVFVGKLNNMSAVMASGDKRGDDSLQYQEVFDNDESCSLVNMPHAPMFYCSAGYFGDLLSFSSFSQLP